MSHGMKLHENSENLSV